MPAATCASRQLDVTWDDWNLVLDTNLRGSFFVAQAVARGMIDHGYGRIINIGSVTSVFGFAGLGPYCASRGGIRQLTMSLADDWGQHGVTVNCLAPGWFKTEQNKVLYEDPEWVAYLTDRIPVKRPGLPNDLDGAVVFLASEASRYITGQTLLVDGGISTGATRATVAKQKVDPALLSEPLPSSARLNGRSLASALGSQHLRADRGGPWICARPASDKP